MVAIYKALRPMVQQAILKNGSVEIGYEDGSSRTISMIQHFYELYLTRELMPHEFVRYKDPSRRRLDLTGIELMVRHPDWPEVKELLGSAEPLTDPHRNATSISFGKKDGRKKIRIVDGIKNRFPMNYSRYIFQKAIGRFLKNEEHVDHIDENKNNDDIVNLQILSGGKNSQKSHSHHGHDIGNLQYKNYVCDECGKSYKRRRRCDGDKRSGSFCSQRCSVLMNNRNRYSHYSKIVKIPCSFCKNVFEKNGVVYRTKVRSGKKHFFCSPKCSNKMTFFTRNNLQDIKGKYNCTWCGAVIYREHHKVIAKKRKGAVGIFCNNSCSGSYVTRVLKKLKAS